MNSSLDSNMIKVHNEKLNKDFGLISQSELKLTNK